MLRLSEPSTFPYASPHSYNHSISYAYKKLLLLSRSWQDSCKDRCHSLEILGLSYIELLGQLVNNSAAAFHNEIEFVIQGIHERWWQFAVGRGQS